VEVDVEVVCSLDSSSPLVVVVVAVVDVEVEVECSLDSSSPFDVVVVVVGVGQVVGQLVGNPVVDVVCLVCSYPSSSI